MWVGARARVGSNGHDVTTGGGLLVGDTVGSSERDGTNYVIIKIIFMVYTHVIIGNFYGFL